jgi:hypothetical protein
MSGARVRLAVAAFLFCGWMGYLGYLALGRPKPVVVSRSQALLATCYVKAEIALDDAGKPNPRARVLDSFGAQPTDLKEINVQNLKDAKLPGGKPFSQAGTYLLPLRRLGALDGAERFELVSAQSGQGYETSTRLPIAYPWSAEAERQARELAAKSD